MKENKEDSKKNNSRTYKQTTITNWDDVCCWSKNWNYHFFRFNEFLFLFIFHAFFCFICMYVYSIYLLNISVFAILIYIFFIQKHFVFLCFFFFFLVAAYRLTMYVISFIQSLFCFVFSFSKRISYTRVVQVFMIFCILQKKKISFLIVYIYVCV